MIGETHLLTCQCTQDLGRRVQAIAVIEILLTHGASLDAWKAAALGDVSRLRNFLAKQVVGADELNEFGRSLLYEGSHNNHLDVVVELLNSGANPNVTNSDGQSPLSTACLHSLSQECDLELIKALLKFGRDTDH